MRRMSKQKQLIVFPIVCVMLLCSLKTYKDIKQALDNPTKHTIKQKKRTGSPGVIDSKHKRLTIKGTYIRQEYIQYCIQIGEMFGIEPELLVAMIETESSGNANASNGYAYGLMQVAPSANKEQMAKLGVYNLMNPYGNILVGTYLIHKYRNEGNEIGLALMRYNGQADAYQRARTGNLSYYARSIIRRTEELKAEQ